MFDLSRHIYSRSNILTFWTSSFNNRGWRCLFLNHDHFIFIWTIIDVLAEKLLYLTLSPLRSFFYILKNHRYTYNSLILFLLLSFPNASWVLGLSNQDFLISCLSPFKGSGKNHVCEYSFFIYIIKKNFIKTKVQKWHIYIYMRLYYISIE